jgi:hypothetical protein
VRSTSTSCPPCVCHLRFARPRECLGSPHCSHTSSWLASCSAAALACAACSIIRARRRFICSSTACSISASVACGCFALHCATAAKISSPCAFQRACKSSGCILGFSLLDLWDNSFPLRQSTISCLIPSTPPQQASGAKKCIAPNQASEVDKPCVYPYTYSYYFRNYVLVMTPGYARRALPLGE